MEKRRRVSRLTRLMRAIDPRAIARNAERLDSLATATRALRDEMRSLQETLTRLTTQVGAAHVRAEELVTLHRKNADERRRMGGLSGEKLLCHSILLDGRPRLRNRVKRLSVGNPVERPFADWIGITRCATESQDVRALWARLLACETATPDVVLRGSPSTILDVGAAIVSRNEQRTVNVSLLERGLNDHAADTASRVTALPRFTSDFSDKKLRNFGHWLLDCLPQVVALSAVAPEAVFLLPAPVTELQRAALGLVGLARHQMCPWNGALTECSRLLIFESDGRAGGGRPLSSLMDMRSIFLRSATRDAGRNRRIYVSRRDARASRRWISNERDVETLFESRGFEIVVMANCSLDDQLRVFRDARIVAGPSGGGLADIVFSPPETHVIVLHTDSLIRWYAEESGARSNWSHGRRASAGELAALGDSPRFYSHLAVGFSQVCHAFLSGDQVPINELSTFLDEVLERVGKEERETKREPIEAPD
jgi:Glycosyltransferase 61